MKKQVLGMAAALFALMLSLFAGAYAADTSAAELSAANTAYAILYEDGTLVFQNSNTPESGKTVTKTYEVDLNAVYSWDDDKRIATTPWFNERKSVRVVNFKDKISPAATAYWFYYCNNLARVDNIQNLDTSNVTTMHSMFFACHYLTALDVSYFNTANVTDMVDMFYECGGLTVLDVSHFNTAKVTDMRDMFYYCSGLTALDVSHFNTAKVTDMRNMFYYCMELTVLDVSRFNTANVTDMSGMFSNCSGLTALDVSQFDTANVTDMKDMFIACNKLKKLDVSNFNTCNVLDMNHMFSGCSELTTLDVFHFDTANVMNMSRMFYGCSRLTELDISQFNTAKVTYMREMFRSCSGLTVLDVSRWDVSNVTDMYYMFRDCSNLKTIYASDKFKTVSTDGEDMFFDCTSLVGGNGTKYDESHTDKEYARIDTASAPGYFTAKDAPAPIPYEITALIPNADTKILTVKLTNPAAATVFVAYFDTKGQFLTTDMKAVPANAGSVELKLLNVNRARVSMFDDQYRPLCSPYVSVLGA